VVLGNTYTSALRNRWQWRSISTLEPVPASLSNISAELSGSEHEHDGKFTKLTPKSHALLLSGDGESPPHCLDGPIVIDGLVRSVRKQKRIAFAHIADGSTLAPVQAVFNDPKIAERYFGSTTLVENGRID